MPYLLAQIFHGVEFEHDTFPYKIHNCTKSDLECTVHNNNDAFWQERVDKSNDLMTLNYFERLIYNNDD